MRMRTKIISILILNIWTAINIECAAASDAETSRHFECKDHECYAEYYAQISKHEEHNGNDNGNVLGELYIPKDQHEINKITEAATKVNSKSTSKVSPIGNNQPSDQSDQPSQSNQSIDQNYNKNVSDGDQTDTDEESNKNSHPKEIQMESNSGNKHPLLVHHVTHHHVETNRGQLNKLSPSFQNLTPIEHKSPERAMENTDQNIEEHLDYPISDIKGSSSGYIPIEPKYRIQPSNGHPTYYIRPLTDATTHLPKLDVNSIGLTGNKIEKIYGTKHNSYNTDNSHPKVQETGPETEIEVDYTHPITEENVTKEKCVKCVNCENKNNTSSNLCEKLENAGETPALMSKLKELVNTKNIAKTPEESIQNDFTFPNEDNHISIDKNTIDKQDSTPRKDTQVITSKRISAALSAQELDEDNPAQSYQERKDQIMKRIQKGKDKKKQKIENERNKVVGKKSEEESNPVVTEAISAENDGETNSKGSSSAVIISVTLIVIITVIIATVCGVRHKNLSYSTRRSRFTNHSLLANEEDISIFNRDTFHDNVDDRNDDYESWRKI